MPFCKGGDYVARNGWRYNKSRAKQRWKCARCNKKFTEDDGFWKMKNTPETITEAIDLYETGHSLEEAKEHLWNHHSIKISETSIRNWVMKYSRKIENFTNTLSPEVKERIHEDEVEMSIRKRKRYFWRAKESKTGFKFSGPVGRRSMKNCQSLNRQIKKKCYQQMLNKKKNGKKKVRFVFDKLPHYKTTHSKMFRNVADITHGIPIKAKQKGLKYNNNVIECEHPAVNERIRKMKGVDDIKFVECVLHLKDILDNFTRRRNKKSMTPAELAGIKLDLGRNKTLGLIYLLLIWCPEDFILSYNGKFNIPDNKRYLIMAKLDRNKTGLALGTFIALMHAVWSLFVAFIPAQLQKFIDWVFVLHHIKPIYTLLPFNIANAVMLVILTFVMGYVFGYVFASIWNRAMK